MEEISEKLHLTLHWKSISVWTTSQWPYRHACITAVCIIRIITNEKRTISITLTDKFIYYLLLIKYL